MKFLNNLRTLSFLMRLKLCKLLDTALSHSLNALESLRISGLAHLLLAMLRGLALESPCPANRKYVR
jgi:hypothetical protein